MCSDKSLFGDPAGIRTPDTLLKRQVLCLLSYWIMKLAGLAGFGPANTRVKVWCLTAWRQPSVRRPTAMSKGCAGPDLPDPASLNGVDNGIRTHGLQSHNLAR